MTKRFLIAVAVLCCLALTFTAGCSKNVKVTGFVNYEDGSPVQNGEIYLEGTVLGRATITNGEFSMGLQKDGQGIPRGTYNVQCSKPLPELKADPSIEAYELVEPTEVKIDGKTNLEVRVRKLTADGAAPGEAFEKAWEEK